MKTLAYSVLGAFAALSVTATVFAADRHVPSVYPTIQSGIDAAQPGDTVIIANGLYMGDGNRDLSFNGKRITVRSANGPETCVIDCDADQADPHRGFDFINGETSASVLEGLTIRGGSTPYGAIADQFNGAAILCANQSHPTIRNCTLTGNWAGCWGGAVCASTQSHPTLDGCTITGNHSNDDGGGVFAWNGSNVTIANCVIAGNNSVVTGGGVTNFGGVMTIRNTTIVNNNGMIGAGIYGWGITIENSIVRGNIGDVQISGAPDTSYSNVEGGFAGDGNVDIDPGFIDAAGGDFRLAAGSAMIDRGDPAFVANPGETDMEGDPRLVGARVDIGADERLTAGDVNRDGFVDFVDLLATLAAWGPCPAGGACDADNNGDGEVDFIDLLNVLANWGG